MEYKAQQIWDKNLKQFNGIMRLDAIILKSMVEFAKKCVIDIIPTNDNLDDTYIGSAVVSDIKKKANELYGIEIHNSLINTDEKSA